MEKRTKQSKKGFIIIESILLLLTIGTLLGTYYFYNKLENLNKEYNELDKKKLKKNEELSDINKQINNLDTQIEEYNNIDSTIETTRKEYFSQIKQLEDDILAGKSNRKIAYITFDDGPYYNTYKVLDILDENDVKATFFTISMNGEYCFDNKSVNCFNLYQEYYKRGHTIANHTYTHGIRGGLYDSVASFMGAIEKQEEHIKNLTGGYVTNITRFPGGSSQAKNLKEPIMESLRQRGYGWVDWTANDGDGKALYSHEQAWNNLYSTVNDNIEVILFHDYNRITTEILPDVIKYLKDNGYELYPLFYESNMISK